MDIFRTIAERRIEEAIRKGELDDLPGKGKPLELDENPYVPAEMRVMLDLLRNANVRPPEVELRRELERLRQRAAAATDDDEKRRLLREAREVQLRIDVMLDLSRRRG